MKKEKITLYINTVSNAGITVGLRIGSQEYRKQEQYSTTRSQIVLPLVQKLLDEHALQLSDLDAISVETGPGSFTGLRVGVSLANTLGYYLGIPINNQPVGQLVEPEYT